MLLKSNKETTTHAWAISHVRIALDHRVHPTSDPTSELVSYAVSGPGKQHSWVASDSKPATGAVGPSAGAALREDDAWSASGAWSFQCCCCCADTAAAASTAIAVAFFLFVAFRPGMIVLELRSYCIYLLCSLRPRQAAEVPPAASRQLGRWICQQGLRSAKIRGLLLVLAAAAAASMTTALAFLRLVIFVLVVL